MESVDADGPQQEPLIHKREPHPRDSFLKGTVLRLQSTQWRPWHCHLNSQLIMSCIALLANVGGGLAGVLARYMQVNAQHPIPGFSLACIVSVLATASLVAFYLVPYKIYTWLLATCSSDAYTEIKESTNAPMKHRLLACLFIGAIVGVRTTALFFAYGLAPAYWIQMLTLLAAIVIALLSWLVFKQSLKRRAVGVMIGAVVCAIFTILMGSEPWKQAASGARNMWMEGLGVVLGCLGTFCIAVYFMSMERTKQLVSGDGILWLSYAGTFLSCLGPAVFWEGHPWSRLALLSWREWSVLLAFVWGILIVVQGLYQLSVRALGAATAALFIPARLLGTTIGSYLLLGEVLTNVWEGLGLCAVAVLVLWYLWQEWIDTRKEQRPGRCVDDGENEA